MICKYCKQDRSPDDFRGRRKCRFCKQEAQNERKRRIRAWLIEYKSTLKCERCHFSDFRALEFHHKDKNKDINIADAVRIGWSIERIKSEIDKCEVICSNCHRIEHYMGLVQSG